MSSGQPRTTPTRRRVVIVSFLVDLFDVATNLVGALVTGSAVVFAEMAQGVADSVGSGLLVVGDRRSSLPVDPEHPHGYRREAFFWAVLSALAMLFIGAGLSAWRGIEQLTTPCELDNSLLAIAVLAVAIATSRCRGSTSLTTVPSIDTVQLVGASSPARMRSAVLLPHPEGPRSTRN